MGVAAIGDRELHLDRRGVNLKLLGDQHRMGGHRALAHLDPVQREDDPLVRMHHEPGVRLELARRLCSRPDGTLTPIATNHRPDHEPKGQRAADGG